VELGSSRIKPLPLWGLLLLFLMYIVDQQMKCSDFMNRE